MEEKRWIVNFNGFTDSLEICRFFPALRRKDKKQGDTDSDWKLVLRCLQKRKQFVNKVALILILWKKDNLSAILRKELNTFWSTCLTTLRHKVIFSIVCGALAVKHFVDLLFHVFKLICLTERRLFDCYFVRSCLVNYAFAF